MNTKRIASGGVIALALLAAMLVIPASAYDHDQTYNANATYFVPEEFHLPGNCSSQNVSIWVNTSFQWATGQLEINFTYCCVNITNYYPNMTHFTFNDINYKPYGQFGTVRIGLGGQVGNEPGPGPVHIGDITVHCCNDSYCETPLEWWEDFEHTYIEDLDGNIINLDTYADGEVSCGAVCLADDGTMFGCGDKVTKSCTLTGDMVCSDSHGLIVAADDITIEGYNATDGKYYSITGNNNKTTAGIYNFNASLTDEGPYGRGYHNVSIRNLTIKNFGTGIWNDAKVQMSGQKKCLSNFTRNTTIYNCTLLDNGNNSGATHGIALECTLNSNIDNCLINGSFGKKGASCSANAGAGIFLFAQSSHNNITNCTITNNDLAGIFARMKCMFNRVENNVINDNGELSTQAGGEWFGGGLRLQCLKSNNWTIKSNTITSNYGPGIYVRGDNNTIGPGNSVTYSKNASTNAAGSAVGAGFGIYLSSDANNNVVSGNNGGFCFNEWKDVCDEGSGNSGSSNRCDTTCGGGGIVCDSPCVPIQLKVLPAYQEVYLQSPTEFEVNVYVETSGTQDVYAVQYKLQYNTSMIKAISQTKGPFLSNPNGTIVSQNVIDNANGICKYAETMKKGSCTNQSGNLTTIKFVTVAGPGNVTTLNFTEAIVVNCTKVVYPSVVLQNGTVNITQAAANVPPIARGMTMHVRNNVGNSQCLAEICACNSSDPDGTIEWFIWDFGDGFITKTPGAGDCIYEYEYKYHKWIGGAGGHYEPFNASVTVVDDDGATDVTYFDVNVYIPGDANYDGIVNVLDAVWVGKHFDETCDNPTCPDPDKCCLRWLEDQPDGADLNNDCKVNILDAVIIGQEWEETAW